MSSDTFDYIVVGGGVGGTVITSRIHERDPSLKILLIEAGPDPTKTSLAESASIPARVGLLKGSELDWNYTSVPQTHLDGREIYAGAGKGLGGGSIINHGLWARGHSAEYDAWADMVGSPRFSFEGMLPYFKKTETHHDPSATPQFHGHHGPVFTASVSSSGRNYALRQPIREAWAELGITKAEDINNGGTVGLAEIVESRTKGLRVIAPAAYPLTNITVLTSTLAHRVLFTTRNGKSTATGVEVADGRTFSCAREVILSAGSLRTPQLLLFLGIGPASELKNHSIPQITESPDVGRNLWEHLGSALEKDLGHSVPDSHPLLREPRSHVALLFNYLGFPMDGTRITSYALDYLPTSHGTVTLKIRDPNENPLIDHHHYETEADRYRIREAVRMIWRCMSTKAGKEMVVREVVTEGMMAVSGESTDEDIDKLVKASSATLQHPAGTASMGKVVDTEFKVNVVDASVIPTPISSPIQAVVYALGEIAVDCIFGQSYVRQRGLHREVESGT
ncbi:putative glucose dehydrogenase [Acephala macrosclerotiorum]|nr:putative glucose dehydrogenase [Acephala macrosclerotiorum]